MSAFSRSWALGKQSLRVLQEDTRLVVFPVISGLACLVTLLSFALPLLATTDWQAVRSNGGSSIHIALTPMHYVLGVVFYFINYTVIAFFNTALVGCVMRRFEGQDAGLGVGLRIALSRFPQILGWSLLASTVGMILRMMSERAGIIGRIAAGFLGFAWSIATYFVVPVLAVDGVGPIEAVKRSAAAIRKTWGESLVTNIGLGAMGFVAFTLAALPLIIGGVISIAMQSLWPVAAGGAATLVLWIALGLVTSTLQAILMAALYRYAATGQVAPGFDGELMKGAFRVKGEKKS